MPVSSYEKEKAEREARQEAALRRQRRAEQEQNRQAEIDELERMYNLPDEAAGVTQGPVETARGRGNKGAVGRGMDYYDRAQRGQKIWRTYNELKSAGELSGGTVENARKVWKTFKAGEKITKLAGKQLGKAAAVEGGKLAAEGLAGAAAATEATPVGWIVTAIILGILIILVIIGFVLGAFLAICSNESGGIVTKATVKVAKTFNIGGLGDLCKQLGALGGTGGPSGGSSTNCNQTFGTGQSAGCQELSSCVNITSYTPTHDCSSNNGVCLASPGAAPKIQAFINTFNSLAGSTGCTLKISSSIQVNGGPSVSSCHSPQKSQSGTCVDFNLLPGHDACYQIFYQAAQTSGAVRSFLDEYVPACMPTNATGGNIHVNF